MVGSISYECPQLPLEYALVIAPNKHQGLSFQQHNARLQAFHDLHVCISLSCIQDRAMPELISNRLVVGAPFPSFSGQELNCRESKGGANAVVGVVFADGV
jgi:hypothetical protein